VPEITRTLRAWSDGQPEAEERLFALVYGKLKRLAAGHLRRESRGEAINTTSLVHEAYLKLIDQRQARWQDRSHFFRMAARVMRNILVDHARRRDSQKRWGGQRRVTLSASDHREPAIARDVVAIHDAITALAEFDKVKAAIVELRFFGGLSTAETAAALGLSTRTVERHWTMAKAWLQRELEVSRNGC
jgi:RNA polymerase sigma factor (TIGR02999 family)